MNTYNEEIIQSFMNTFQWATFQIEAMKIHETREDVNTAWPNMNTYNEEIYNEEIIQL